MKLEARELISIVTIIPALAFQVGCSSFVYAPYEINMFRKKEKCIEITSLLHRISQLYDTGDKAFGQQEFGMIRREIRIVWHVQGGRLLLYTFYPTDSFTGNASGGERGGVAF